MKASFKHTSLLVLLVLGSSLAMRAQGVQFAAKFGGGAVVGAIGEQNSRATMNAAFIAEYSLGKNREVFGEINYRVFRSVDHEATDFSSLGYTPAGVAAPLYPRTTVDVRKDNLDGYALTAGYRQQILDTVFWWQGGVSMNFLTSQQEVTGQIAPGVTGIAPNVVTDANREGLNFTPGKRSVRPGFFVGAQAKLSPNFFTEVNLNGAGYQWVNYVPYSYTGQPAHVETSSKFKVSLDLNIGFRF